MELTRDLLEKCLQEYRKQQQRKKKYKEYYEGEHDILRDYKMAKSRSNMRIVVNFFRKFINDEIAYSLGHPVNYISRSGDAGVVDKLERNFAHWEKVHDQNLMKQTNIYGEAYELWYTTEDGEFRATVLNPLNAFVVESGDAEGQVKLALHEYPEDMFSDHHLLDVYFENEIHHYRISKHSKIVGDYLGAREINFSRPPVRICEANPERQSMLDDIKRENDAYNNVLSDLVNEVSDFRQAFLKIIGADITTEDAERMKESGILKVNNDKVKIEYLTKEINDTFVQNLLANLEEKMYKMASHIDTNEKLQSNLSGTALRSRMIALENKCTLMQSMLEQTMKERLKAYFGFVQRREGESYDYKDVQLKFTMNIPADINLLADTISKLENTVSQETLLSLLPFVENPKVEVERFKKEVEERRSGMIDLDSVGLNPQATAGDDDDTE
ncbi:phage portal protein [Salimicrobium halophilum]|uniref:Phage portal protein, SPP1 family n=1 Tax=Salimicrobium halophilum TaxID=86666 RepID=A0A1G8WDR0_9BACI|nr:phage portal protein [Salimicrobium halophilum]SDJ76392.1 phage portal protein, SPP1 family [Salimicrobium halophilum]